jgi:ferrous-iron efflux pump FieF
MSEHHTHCQHNHFNPALKSSKITIILVLALVIAKTIALVISGSAAVLSALIDSLGDIGLSIMTLIAVQWSLKPADDNHRYGHGKVEAIAAMIQGMILAGGGIFLVFEAFGRFINPTEIKAHIPTLALMAFSILFSALIAYVQKRGAEDSNSLAVEADSKHYASDVLINGAVFLVVLADYFDILGAWLDPLCALGVAGLMAKSAYEIIISAVAMLLDQELPAEQRNKIIAKIKSHPSVLGYHDLRTSQSGMKTLISCDIELPPTMTVGEAHTIIRHIESTIQLDFPNSEIMIHVDPQGDTADSRHHI